MERTSITEFKVLISLNRSFSMISLLDIIWIRFYPAMFLT
jgi:hypothetical protein